MNHIQHQHRPQWFINFLNIYQQLSIDNLHLIDDLYHSDVIFKDAVHEIKGLPSLKEYFDDLYTNLSYCRFTIDHTLLFDNEAAIYWTMEYAHKSINKGQRVKVAGHSYIKGVENKVSFHRDYLDMGAMLYEHLPLLGRVIKMIKRRMQKAA